MTIQAPTFSAAQVKAAKALLASGGLAPAVFTALSSDGKTKYVVDRNGCTCPAQGPCKHQLAVLMELNPADWKV